MLKNKNIFIASLITVCFAISIYSGLTKAENNGIEDTKITTLVKSKLLLQKNIPSTKITVETNQGVVYLSGTIPTEKQADTVVEVAESVEGVKNVDASNLKIMGDKEPLTDSLITAKIKGLFIREKIFGNKSISAMTIKVETKNGTVYLTGIADDSNQINNAINIAKTIEGVKNVVNTVKVR